MTPELTESQRGELAAQLMDRRVRLRDEIAADLADTDDENLSALAGEVRDAGDFDRAGSQHDFIVSVLSGTDESAGFAAVKTAAVAVAEALERAELTLDRGDLAGMWFLRAKARRVENGAARRVDLTFRARIDLD